MGDSGAYLEDKQYAVAIHTRRVANPDRWAAPIDQAARQIAERHGQQVILGKQVWELRPAVHSDKGDAIRRVIGDSKARGVVVAGDDLGDLSAFAAALELKAAGADALRIAMDSAEAPPALSTRPISSSMVREDCWSSSAGCSPERSSPLVHVLMIAGLFTFWMIAGTANL